MSIVKVLFIALVVCLAFVIASVVLAVAGAAGFVRGKLAAYAPKAVPHLITLGGLLGICLLLAIAFKLGQL